MSYTLIERKELASDASSMSFDNIPQFYSDLLISFSSRTTQVISSWSDVILRFNGSTSNYSSRLLYSDSGGGAASFTETSIIMRVSTASNTSNTFANNQVYIPNYAGATTKSVSIENVQETNATTAFNGIIAGLWSDTSPIISLSLTAGSGNLVAGSSISLYGINRQQAIGAPKAVGGSISFANGYWVHSFTGSGTFSAKEAIECEYLVVAGGGGGASVNGGGGAGGYRSSVSGEFSGGGASREAPLKLTPMQSVSVLVGSGGSGGSGLSSLGVSGTSSELSSISAMGGGGGGGYGNPTGLSGLSGGSGGGGGFGQSSGTASGGSGISGQGYAGGSAQYYSSGGGGGAGAIGGAGLTAVSAGGNGGAGVFSSITGTLVGRAGGGGAGTESASRGIGTSGGGNGAARSPYAAGSSGTANTGGGGGGGENSVPTGGYNGGSGIVIIRYKA